MTKEELLAHPAEAYMNENHRAFFRDLLLAQRVELQARISGEVDGLREHEPSGDYSDLGRVEEQREWQLTLLEREDKLLEKIDVALERMARGEYGWCKETGEPIGLRRLLLRPAASLCIEAQELQEHKQRHMRPERGRG